MKTPFFVSFGTRYLKKGYEVHFRLMVTTESIGSPNSHNNSLLCN